MLQTLEHLPDPLSACRGAWHCLRPWRTEGPHADCHANGTHLQFFARNNLFQLLKAAGFERCRRLVGFGGGQHRRLLPAAAQYALRLAGWSSELRMGWRTRAPPP